MRPRIKVTDDDGDGLPLSLQAARCIEVWSPDRGDWHEAWRRYGVARREWNAAHPDRHLAAGPTWSFEFVRETRGEAWLADWLADRGLPADWTTTAV